MTEQIVVYKFDADENTFNEIARLAEDGNVTGNSWIASGFRDLRDYLNSEWGVGVDELWTYLTVTFTEKYNNGYLICSVRNE